MTVVLVIVLLFGGAGGSKTLDFSDPAVLAAFKQNVNSIIPDQERARRVYEAVFEMNEMSIKSRSPQGLIATDIAKFREVATDYGSSRDEVYASLRQLYYSLGQVTRKTVQGREVIRQNTSKREWKKLLKALNE